MKDYHLDAVFRIFESFPPKDGTVIGSWPSSSDQKSQTACLSESLLSAVKKALQLERRLVGKVGG